MSVSSVADPSDLYAKADQLGQSIARQLGLPPYVRRLELRFEAMEMPIVRVEFYPNFGPQFDDLTTRLAEFRLVPVDQSAPAGGLPAAPAQQ